MARDVAETVRAVYEERPYPRVTRADLRRPPWRLPAVDWIKAVAQPGPSWPQRILVAGCGTGLEAFALRRRFPDAEIVGIDFAQRSIREARRLQKRSAAWRDIRFLRADLTSDRLRAVTGGDFDFISCHGVLSYLPGTAGALRNLARALAREGVFYLGVNGSTHFSESWRKFLPAFGFEMKQWPGGKRLWQHLKLTAAVAGEAENLSHDVSYLASDLFGGLIRNLPLADWVRMCRRAGLHFRANDLARRMIWPAINNGSYELFLPRSRGEVAELMDVLRPLPFFRMICTRQPEALPPWQEPSAFLDWRPRRTEYFRRFKWPARNSSRLFRLSHRQANVAIELRGAGWEFDLFRQSDGQHSLRQILASRPVTPAALRSQLYLFYLLELLNFLPPLPRPSSGPAAR